MHQYSIYESRLAENHGFDSSIIEDVEQIGSKQAWILTDSNGNKWLQSYHTIVSCKKRGETVLHLGNWSRTTSKHQSTFARMVY